MVERLHVETDRDRPVRQHQVEPVHRQVAEQHLQRVFLAHESHRRVEIQRRPQHLVGDQLGNRVDDTDVQKVGQVGSTVVYPVGEFGAQREDFLCIAVHSLPGLGQHQAAADAVEQRAADRFLQPLDLAADRLGRQVQDLGRPRDAALAGDRVKVQQVVVIEVPHAACSDGCRFE